MKKLLLLIAGISIGQVAGAQLWLNGADYTQNFNGLSATSNTLPAGWQLSTTATANALGANVTSTNYQASGRTWKSVNNGFRNVASANGYTYFATIGNDSLAQAQRTDRALAVRQTGAVGDSSTAFMLQIGNTQNLTDFKLDFKLQSLDSTSSRVTTWRVDYGIGSNPTSFTPATITSSTPLTTGGNTFSNNTISASFGNGLDNKAGNVWIRIVTLTKTTGSQNRATSGIDDFHLTWSGNAVGVQEVKGRNELSVSVLGQARRDGFTVKYNALATGKYNVSVYDIAGKEVHRSEFMSVTGANQVAVNGLSLNSGMYIVKVSNDNYSGTVKTIVE